MTSSCTVAIMQPYFLPYLGYFQLMASSEIFVIYDDVNYISRGWINRNRINLNGEAHTITVPLNAASQNKLIHEIHIIDNRFWREKILKTLRQAYKKATQYDRIYPLVEAIINNSSTNLADYLHNSLVTLHKHLKLQTRVIRTSRIYGNNSLKSQSRIIDICKTERASRYLNPVSGF